MKLHERLAEHAAKHPDTEDPFFVSSKMSEWRDVEVENGYVHVGKVRASETEEQHIACDQCIWSTEFSDSDIETWG